MRMDIDCIRDILLQAEQREFTIIHTLSNDEDTQTSKLQFINKYEIKKLMYHINLANELGLLKITRCIGATSVKDLSAQGHLFLADIREDNVWNKTKEISKQIGASSLDTVKQIAVNVVSSLISNYFQK